MEGLASMFMATDRSRRWLLKVGMAVAVSYSKTTVKSTTSINSFTNDFSAACNAV